MKYYQIEKQIGKKEIYHICFSVYKSKWLFQGIYKRCLNKLIIKIAKDKNIKIFIFKIMPDHVHVLLKKDEKQLVPQIAQYLKGMSSFYLFKNYPQLKRDMKTLHLWTSGYWAVKIKDKKQFNNTYNYIKNNDLKYKEFINKNKNSPTL